MKTARKPRTQTKVAVPETALRILAPAVKAARRTTRGTVGATVVAATPPQPVNKKRLIETMLRRADGCTVSELIAATGWQKHSLRAAMTGFRKAGCTIDRDNTDGPSRYRIVGVS